MNVRPITGVLPGEHVLGVDPQMLPTVGADRLRRPNLYTGRSLSEVALGTDQTERGARLALRGQMVSAGVVQGFAVQLEQTTGGAVIHVAPGLGLAASGEDVFIPRQISVPVSSILVYAPATTGVQGPDPVYQDVRKADGGPPLHLGEILADSTLKPLLTRAAFLVIQPLLAAIAGNDDSNDPAPQDPDAYAYADEQLTDACRVVLCTWPTAWLALPAPNLPQWRSRLAASLFAHERGLSPDPAMPWDDVGVPIGLVAFDASFGVSFIDRSAAARIGGAPCQRTQLVGGRGSPRLWQARIRQFSEHLADLGPTRIADGSASADFRYLPPVGLLPKAVLDVTKGVSGFFPPSFAVEAVPIPLEQIDVAITASASLDRLDMNAFERVRLLVPVPQIDFEPALLDLRTTIDPAFAGAKLRALTRLDGLLGHRQDVRAKAKLLLDAIEGARLYRFVEPDPAADLEEQLSTADVKANPEDPFGTETRQFVPPLPAQPDDPELRLPGLNALFETWPDGRWESLGLITTIDPVVISTDPGSIDLFARSEDGQIWQRSFRSGVWQPWSLIQVLSGTQLQPSIPVAVGAVSTVSRGSSLIDLFARRLSDGALVHKWFEANAWKEEVVTPSTSPIDSDPVGVSWAPGRYQVLYRGKDNLVYAAANKTPTDGSLGPVAGVGGGTILQGLSAVSWGNGRIDVFARSFATKGLVHKTFSNGAWSGDEVLSGPINSDPAAVSWGFGHLDVFFEVRANSLFQRTFDGGVWQAAVPHGAIAHAKKVHACSWGPGRIDLLVRGWDNLLYHQWFDGVAWHGWQPLADGLTSEPASVSFGPGYFDLFAARLDGAVWHRNKLPDSTWAAFEGSGLGGVVAAYDALVNKVEDTLNLGFVRAQAAIYRLRQQVLSSDGASRLSTSPVLADIAKGESAIATKERVSDYLIAAKNNKIQNPPDKLPPSPPSLLFTAPDLLSDAVMPSLALSRSALGGDQAAAVVQVRGQMAIPGATPIQRTLSLAERLARPASVDTWQFALSTKYEVLTALAALNIDVSGIVVPGLQRQPIELTLLRSPTEAAKLLTEPHPPDNDEAGYFSVAVELVEHAIIGLRAIEGRVEVYRGLGSVVQRALDALNAFAIATDRRLKELGDQILEARQDVVVARSLLAEEQARVAKVVARRTLVLTQAVPFFVFQRPRQSDVFVDGPVRALDSAAADEALPAALASTVAAPPELHAMIELLREAPVRWFTSVPGIFLQLDRLDALHRTLFAARERAASRSLFSLTTPLPGLLGQGLLQAFSAQMEIAAANRRVAAAMDPASLSALSWSESQRKAAEVVSLGDLMDAGHGRADVARSAASELENIQKVATSLYLRFGAVDPKIRLVWAEQASQYDAPIDLRQLANLPRWQDIHSLERREMMVLSAWLFQRVDAGQPSAVSLMNDLVRVAMLLASHAPVNELISGRVSKPTTAVVGGLVEVAVDESKIRVNMHALLDGLDSQAHAVVEDIGAGIARVRILSLTAQAPSVRLSSSTLVRFAEPERGTVLFKKL